MLQCAWAHGQVESATEMVERHCTRLPSLGLSSWSPRSRSSTHSQIHPVDSSQSQLVSIQVSAPSWMCSAPLPAEPASSRDGCRVAAVISTMCLASAASLAYGRMLGMCARAPLALLTDSYTPRSAPHLFTHSALSRRHVLHFPTGVGHSLLAHLLQPSPAHRTAEPG
jgi:hypothetical protein